jgi:phosphoribosyl-ATP pyrophosphohydrolase/phosphoribosyl-AMP cyclohydrolase
MAQIDIDAIDWTKGDGLVPAIIQNAASGQVLMLGYMDRAALDATVSSGKVTFFSRSKNRLWVKGGNIGALAEFCQRRNGL